MHTVAIDLAPDGKLKKKTEIRPSKAVQLERQQRLFLSESGDESWHSRSLEDLVEYLRFAERSRMYEETHKRLRASAELRANESEYPRPLRIAFASAMSLILAAGVLGIVGIVGDFDSLKDLALMALAMGGALGYACLSKAEGHTEPDARQVRHAAT
jgi:hypothetical protein